MPTGRTNQTEVFNSSLPKQSANDHNFRRQTSETCLGGDQAARLRGGGTGGLCENDGGGKPVSERRVKSRGARQTIAGCSLMNSSFFTSCGSSAFFSARLPASIDLQSLQGCLPSKVFVKASSNEAVRRLFANIFVHAIVWSAAQCPPVAPISATINRQFPSRTNMP